MNMPSAVLLFTGILLVAIGLFVAGNMIIVTLGVVCMIAAGSLQVLATRRA